jgi:hypothetical protein
VEFNIHSHTAEDATTIHYAVKASADSGEWTLPGPDVYFLEWKNPNEVGVELAYFLELLPPPQPTDYTVPILLSVAAAIFIAILLRGLRKRRHGIRGKEEH